MLFSSYSNHNQAIDQHVHRKHTQTCLHFVVAMKKIVMMILLALSTLVAVLDEQNSSQVYQKFKKESAIQSVAIVTTEIGHTVSRIPRTMWQCVIALFFCEDFIPQHS